MASLDDLDRKLIAILRQDARRTISELAGELQIARATVRSRIARLEGAGEIVGYTVVLRSDAEPQPVRALVMVEVEGRSLDRVVDSLKGFPEVGAIHTTNGRWDIVCELATADLQSLDAFLWKIRLVPGIATSETTLLLATQRSSRARP